MIVTLPKNPPRHKYHLSDGTPIPGASTVAKVDDETGGLVHWAWKLGMEGKDYRKERDISADIGIVAHFIILCFFKGDEPDLSAYNEEVIARAKAVFKNFMDFWMKEHLKVVEAETELVSEVYRYGGTPDLLALDKDNRYCLIDWKSTNTIRPSHLLQVSAYEKLIEENRPVEIRRRAIVRMGKQENDMDLRWMAPMDYWFKEFQAQLNLYHIKRERPTL